MKIKHDSYTGIADIVFVTGRSENFFVGDDTPDATLVLQPAFTPVFIDSISNMPNRRKILILMTKSVGRRQVTKYVRMEFFFKRWDTLDLDTNNQQSTQKFIKTASLDRRHELSYNICNYLVVFHLLEKLLHLVVLFRGKYWNPEVKKMTFRSCCKADQCQQFW